MATGTNAARLLDRLKIPYTIREYSVDPNDLTAETVANKIGLPPEQVFKTLAVRGDRQGVCLAVIPGNYELHLKSLAAGTRDRKMELLPLKEVQSVTGYLRGAVTALANRKLFPVWLDETAELHDVISVSAGIRGSQILLAPGDYIRAVGAQTAGISRPKIVDVARPVPDW